MCPHFHATVPSLTMLVLPALTVCPFSGCWTLPSRMYQEAIMIRIRTNMYRTCWSILFIVIHLILAKPLWGCGYYHVPKGRITWPRKTSKWQRRDSNLSSLAPEAAGCTFSQHALTPLEMSLSLCSFSLLARSLPPAPHNSLSLPVMSLPQVPAFCTNTFYLTSITAICLHNCFFH